jgi:hypothetical protein
VLKNSAFVFVKPHANTAATQAMVKSKLEGAGITIMSESDISGPEIDEKKLIDQHYYAIASKATILPASEIPVPADKFKAEFGLEWADALKEGKAVNAMEACKKFGCDAAALNEAWSKSSKVVKFGGGFYCGIVTVGDHDPLYVFNAFFMSMRSKFVGADDSIHCYAVEWDPSTLSWSDFRNNLLGYVHVCFVSPELVSCMFLFLVRPNNSFINCIRFSKLLDLPIHLMDLMDLSAKLSLRRKLSIFIFCT